MQYYLTELRKFFTIVKYNIQNAKENRLAFITQIVGMMINNTAFIIVWVLFFHIVGSINGWSTADTIGLQGMTAFAFGAAFALGAGVQTLSRTVHSGGLDAILLSPTSTYLRIFSSRFSISVLGDIIFGLICMIIYLFMSHADLYGIILFFLSAIPAILIIMNIAFVSASLCFWINDGEDIGYRISDIMFGTGMYPGVLFTGFVRVFFFIIVPSLAIGNIQVEIAKTHHIAVLVVLYGIALFWILLARFVLKRGLRHYESGNLVGSRD